MNIAGLQKMTLLDYPGKIACTVFLGGCNFRCPFCHNGELLDGSFPPLMDEAELLAFLEKRRGMLDGVCVTGGEPTLHKGLGDLLRAIKELGFQVKLDTNGYRPDVLKALVQAGLVDYVAMDVKNSPRRYAKTVGLDIMDLSAIEESLRFLLTGTVDYELRTTVVSRLHDEESFRDIAGWLNELGGGVRAKRFFLQSFVDRETVLQSGLSAPSPEELEVYSAFLDSAAQFVEVRGV